MSYPGSFRYALGSFLSKRSTKIGLESHDRWVASPLLLDYVDDTARSSECPNCESHVFEIIRYSHMDKDHGELIKLAHAGLGRVRLKIVREGGSTTKLPRYAYRAYLRTWRRQYLRYIAAWAAIYERQIVAHYLWRTSTWHGEKNRCSTFRLFEEKKSMFHFFRFFSPCTLRAFKLSVSSRG